MVGIFIPIRGPDMKKKRRIENRIIAVILCMAILFSQVNIADAADVNPSGTNTSQVTLSDDANKSNGEVLTVSTDHLLYLSSHHPWISQYLEK